MKEARKLQKSLPFSGGNQTVAGSGLQSPVDLIIYLARVVY